MTEPASVGVGLKSMTAVSGFVGAILSLTYMRELNRVAVLTTVGAGTATAFWVSPLIIWAWPSLADIPQGGLGFLLGFTAMNLLAGLTRLSEVFRDNPARFLPWKK